MSLSVEQHQQYLDTELYRATGGTVQRGPFKGLKLGPLLCHGEASPKLLGCYEEEIHDALERCIARNPAKVVNIGSAEGYYAVGLARRLPTVPVVAFDPLEPAQTLTRFNAQLNEQVIEVRGLATLDALQEALIPRSLIVCDCEGAEVDLMNPAQLPTLAECDFIVECHDFLKPGLANELMQRFSQTHALEHISEGARNPNGEPTLRKLHSVFRWLAVCENRPECMSYLAGFCAAQR